jgi:DNA-directed RNA polymerase subunit beta
MNIGQILETHLGWAAKGLGNKIDKMMRAARRQPMKCASFLDEIYNGSGKPEELNDRSTTPKSSNWRRICARACRFATPVFDGATRSQDSCWHARRTGGSAVRRSGESG